MVAVALPEHSRPLLRTPDRPCSESPRPPSTKAHKVQIKLLNPSNPSARLKQTRRCNICLECPWQRVVGYPVRSTPGQGRRFPTKYAGAVRRATPKAALHV